MNIDVPKRKILAIKFKYLGDVVVCTPALRAFRQHYPDAELHVLVAREAVPVLAHTPWIDRVWGLPRQRGKVKLAQSMPMILQLRKESFTHSIDFVGNDRGAMLSRAVGAKNRLGLITQRGPEWRKWCYTQTIEELDPNRHEVVRDIYALKPWGISLPDNLELETHFDPKLSSEAHLMLPGKPVIAHCSSSQRKKEWSLKSWLEFHARANHHGEDLVFSAGPSEREQALLGELRSHCKDVKTLPKVDSLDLFMAVLAASKAVVSVDTATLHLAAGLKRPTIGLFGPTDSRRWSPPGPMHRAIQGNHCDCSGHSEICERQIRCIDAVNSGDVWNALQQVIST